MKTAALPENEQIRLQTLKSYEIFRSLPDRDFDDLALVAAQICNTPIALVSLTGSTEQWFKARVGLDTEEIPRDLAFCASGLSTLYLNGIKKL